MIDCEKFSKITCLAFSLDYQKIFLGNVNGELIIYEIKSKKLVIMI